MFYVLALSLSQRALIKISIHGGSMFRPSHKMRDHNYQWHGDCIMCLDPNQKELTIEHIIPAAIGGTLRFRSAVCSDCAKAQNKLFENHTLNHDLLPARHLLQLRKRPPGRQFGGFARRVPGAVDEDGQGVYETISPDEYPSMLHFLLLEPPGKLRGIDVPDLTGFRLGFRNLTGLVPKHGIDGQEYRMDAPMVSGAFPMSIAKMGYCYAVAERGLTSFNGEEIRDLLQGRREDIMNFVGGDGDPPNKVPRGLPLHSISLHVHPGQMLVARITLFSSYGLPSYLVVVGRLV